MSRRLKAMGATGYENGFALTLHPERLLQSMRRKAPTMYFVNSMSDLFHADVPDSFIDDVLDVCRATPQHTYQILTKRAGRLPGFFRPGTVRAMCGSECRWRIAAMVRPASSSSGALMRP
jgi:protein gp37